jgi:hypothetical protein
MTTKVSIEGYGVFTVSTNKVADLIAWLQANYSPLQEVITNQKGQLINE